MVEHGDRFQEDRVDPFVDAYEEAQARDGHADLAAFLPEPGHPLFEAVLCELVRVDLEYGWTRGRPVPLEDYLARFPSLRKQSCSCAAARRFRETRGPPLKCSPAARAPTGS